MGAAEVARQLRVVLCQGTRLPNTCNSGSERSDDQGVEAGCSVSGWQALVSEEIP